MTNVKKLKCGGRLFFVSDIHGEINTLLHGLKELGFDKNNDMCIHAGDLIDRGSDSFNSAIHFLSGENPAFHTVLGNHDVFSFQGDNNLWVYNGGGWAFNELSDQERHMLGSMMIELPYAIEVEHGSINYGVVHAGVPEELSWQELCKALENNNPAAKQECVWMRDIVQYKDYYTEDNNVKGIDFTIHGHTPVKEPLLIGNRLHIDTGLVYGKYLTITEASSEGFEHHKFNIVL